MTGRDSGTAKLSAGEGVGAIVVGAIIAVGGWWAGSHLVIAGFTLRIFLSGMLFGPILALLGVWAVLRSLVEALMRHAPEHGRHR